LIDDGDDLAETRLADQVRDVVRVGVNRIGFQRLVALPVASSRLINGVASFLPPPDEEARMFTNTSTLLTVIALVLALASAFTVVPLWIAIVLLALAMLARDRVRLLR
jgi:hypothetical protein